MVGRWEVGEEVGGGGGRVGGGGGGGGGCWARWEWEVNRTVPTGTSPKQTEDNANRTEPNRNTHEYW